jgi:hypothetical protein
MSLSTILLAVLSCLAAGRPAYQAGGANDDRDTKTARFRFEGTYRLRGERQDGFNLRSYGTGAGDDFLLSRLRLEVDWAWSSRLRLHAQAQDARTLGLSFSDQDFSGGNNPFHDPLDVNQLYVDYQFSRKARLIVGRQALSYGDRRVFGPGDWGNTGRYAWDALRLEMDGTSFSSHWIAGRFILHDPDRWPNTRAEGPTAYASYNSIKSLPFLLDLFYVYKHDGRGLIKGETGTGNLSSHSLGFRIDWHGRPWDGGAMFAGQFGRWGPDDLRAHGLAFSLGRTFQGAWTPYLAIQYVLGSGDHHPADGIHGTFDGLFSGADSILYGWMNLFFWQNLREFRIDLTMTPVRTLAIRVEYHLFGLDAAEDAWYFPGKALRRDTTGTSGRRLGQEADLTIRKKLSDRLEILGGVCVFRPGEFVKNTGGSPPARWAFVESTISF